MNNEPLVSIAMCTYNGAAYLQQQMDTIVGQSYKNIEIIIIDDGSADETVQILQQYAASNSNIKLYQNQQNLGYVKNFEKAIGLCNGDYIALADQDDIWSLDKIQQMVDEVGDAMLIYHDSELVNDEGQNLGRMSNLINMYSGSSPLAFLFYNSVSGHSCMFRAELVPHLGSFNPKFYHDWWIAFVAANKGRVAFLDKLLVKYRQHQNANTDILRIRKIKSKQTRKIAELNLPWLAQCSTQNGKCQQIINRILRYCENKGSVNSLKLIILLFKHAKELFFLKKKSYTSKLNYIRKMVFQRRY
jgi:glycosyltransferase involved in cell wall biosynthesis